MKIAALEVYLLRAPDTGRPHWVSNFIVPRANEVLVRLHTDEGLSAIEGAGLVERLRPRWLEEPVRWANDRRELKLLAQRTRIPLSAGESEPTGYACRALLEEQAIAILQFDCTMAGGFTEGRKLAALCELNHVEVAPHHDCYIHAQLVAATPAGLIVEAFDPEHDPLQTELFENPPEMEAGWLTLNDAPGLGLTLSGAALRKFGERVA